MHWCGMAKQRRVLIATPLKGDLPAAYFKTSLQMATAAIPNAKLDWVVLEGPAVQMARNEIVAYARQEKFDELLFWDKDVLITWTSNIQGWMNHGSYEFSSKLQTIEIYSPNRDKNGKFLGLNHESIFYDPEALVEPVRIIRNYVKTSDFQKATPFVFIECIPTIYPVDGKATAVSPGQVIPFKIPDMYGRPWAQNWEQNFEQGMSKPVNEDIFKFD